MNEEIEKLRQILLSRGGVTVNIPSVEEDLEDLLLRGTFINTEGLSVMEGKPARCHENSSNLFEQNRGKVAICTGYALYEETWYQHSWLVKLSNGRIVETTFKRKEYFGFKMTQVESEKFAMENY